MCPAARVKARPRSDYLATTPARPGSCRACGRVVLKGHDEGWPIAVEAEALGEVDEALDAERRFVLQGRRTYVLTSQGQLWERTPYRVNSGSPRGPIHVEHVCPKGAK